MVFKTFEERHAVVVLFLISVFVFENISLVYKDRVWILQAVVGTEFMFDEMSLVVVFQTWCKDRVSV